MPFARFFLSLLLGGAVILPAMTAAQTTHDGRLGSSSTGQLLIFVSNRDLIKISNLSDILLSRNNVGEFVGGTDACVYRNATGTYTLTAYGSGENGKFSIIDGQRNSLNYHVSYDDGTGSIAVTSSLALRGRLNANTQSVQCAGGNNASITIQVDAEEVDKAPAGTYSGGLTLVVSPE